MLCGKGLPACGKLPYGQFGSQKTRQPGEAGQQPGKNPVFCGRKAHFAHTLPLFIIFSNRVFVNISYLFCQFCTIYRCFSWLSPQDSAPKPPQFLPVKPLRRPYSVTPGVGAWVDGLRAVPLGPPPTAFDGRYSVGVGRPLAAAELLPAKNALSRRGQAPTLRFLTAAIWWA